MMQQAQGKDQYDFVGRLSISDAASIPSLTHAEATKMATAEFERFLVLVEAFSPADWDKPTVCPLWNVRQVVAHVTGAAASYAHWSEFKRQNSRKAQRPYRQAGFSMLDALNQIQVNDRASATPAALINELQRVGPRAIATRERLPTLLRALRVPLPALGGIVPIGYLTDLIYTRDMWMHRLDLCRATGREMVLTPDHDGRIVALIIRDLGKKLAAKLRTTSLVYHLSGPIGGRWQLGAEGAPRTTIRLDVLDFNLLASGRLTPDEAEARTSIEGDNALAREILKHTTVPY